MKTLFCKSQPNDYSRLYIINSIARLQTIYYGYTKINYHNYCVNLLIVLILCQILIIIIKYFIVKTRYQKTT